MISLARVFTVFSFLWTAAPICFAAVFELAETAPQTVRLTENGIPVWEYVYGQKDHPWAEESDPRRISGCYFHPLYGFGGESVTLDAPDWDGHTHHHALWNSFTTTDILRGDERIHYDTWTDNTPLKKDFIEWLCREETPDGWLLGVRNGWFLPGENGDRQQVADERVEILTSPVKTDPDAGKYRTLDMTLSWTPLRDRIELAGDRPVKKDFAGMQIRFAYPASVPKIFSRDGEFKDDVDVGSGTSPWTAYESDFAADGRKLAAEQPRYVELAGFPVIAEGAGKPTSGAAIFEHPENPDFKGGCAVRFYGLLSTGWPGLAGETIEPGETRTLKYRIVIYEKPMSADSLDRLYREYEESVR